MHVAGLADENKDAQRAGNHPKADPALDTGIPFVPAATQSMPSFDHADATLAAGPPFLAVAEPTLLLFAFALRALGGAVGDADVLAALGFCGRLVLGRVEAGIRVARCGVAVLGVHHASPTIKL